MLFGKLVAKIESKRGTGEVSSLVEPNRRSKTGQFKSPFAFLKVAPEKAMFGLASEIAAASESQLANRRSQCKLKLN